MRYLDPARLEAIDEDAFRAADPFPWTNPAGLLTDEGFAELRASLPDPDLFERRFGESRKHGQASHDRLNLEYHEELPVARAWHDFVGELRSEAYRGLLARLLGTGRFTLRFHWHYTPRGAAVSPHCDARRKLASHIFYLNTEDDWDPAWGGETLILDDRGRHPPGSAPDFDDFERVLPSRALGNHSLLFASRGQSWHGVRAIDCPEGALRRIFIVVVDDAALSYRLHDWLKGSRLARY